MTAPRPAVPDARDTAAPAHFRILETDAGGPARNACLVTPHGVVTTPAFMPVATQGTVKGITPAQLTDVGVQMVLSNAYHLAVRPGVELIRDHGGLHRFMGWNGPILTDSGGYQIFSLASLRTVSDDGVRFRSHVDGAAMFFTPEDVIRIQAELGVDILMVLDECAPGTAGRREAERAAQRTVAWAARARRAAVPEGRLVFAIVQGATFEDLRLQVARELVSFGFPGYAVGGLSVGEERSMTMALAEATAAALPVDRPRYLMGVGFPEELIRFVGMGYDLFDCVLPTRNARNGMLFTSAGRINIRLAQYARDQRPVDERCACYTCGSFTRAYLRHLALTHEMLGAQLATLHNLFFYQQLMRDMQAAIAAQAYGAWAAERLSALDAQDA